MPIQGLRSPHEKVGPFLYFGRMVDKARLHAAGELPEEYKANLGEGFDKFCLGLFGVSYSEFTQRVQQGGTEDEILAAIRAQGRPLTDQDIFAWNEFMRKRGWNDEATPRLNQRKAESGFSNRNDIQTFFDYIDADEGRR